MVVIACCYCSPDPEGPKYEQYCMQKFMQHQSFRQLEDLLGASNIHMAAYSLFLRSGSVNFSLADVIYWLETAGRENREAVCHTNEFPINVSF